MTKEQRRAQINRVEGRYVREELHGKRYVVVIECDSMSALKRSREKLQGLGWRFVKMSGLSMMVEVKL